MQVQAIVSDRATDRIVLTIGGQPTGRGPVFGGIPENLEEFASALTAAAQWGHSRGVADSVARVKEDNARLLSQIRGLLKAKP